MELPQPLTHDEKDRNSSCISLNVRSGRSKSAVAAVNSRTDVHASVPPGCRLQTDSHRWLQPSPGQTVEVLVIGSESRVNGRVQHVHGPIEGGNGVLLELTDGTMGVLVPPQVGTKAAPCRSVATPQILPYQMADAQALQHHGASGPRPGFAAAPAATAWPALSPASQRDNLQEPEMAGEPSDLLQLACTGTGAPCHD
jgi:hypothetical protein